MTELNAATRLNASEVSKAQVEKVKHEFEKQSGGRILELTVDSITPLEATAVCDSELTAYKLAYAYSQHAHSLPKVEHSSNLNKFYVSFRGR